MIHLIEDEANIRKLLEVNLSKRGHAVIESSYGRQALQHLQEYEPELVILNIKLPDLSGFEILDHLENTYPESATPPVILVTAASLDTDRVLRRYPRVVKIFAKPFDMNELIDLIRWIMDK